ncbi:hypothetical protein OSB04_015364 [Centaurea solstitialis]|uniref:non-specific serine/threonine protein kinase n=1 Tax=Centaurea solstitialis TaxID=347529 RepID=A0AA38T0H7_9ASTR|nr:hypothetical protein OSB04_015364 [Centaurea solstitialis]
MSSSTGKAYRVSSSSSVQPCHQFSFAEIQSATNDFDDQLVIGEGGFGKVYKGCIYIEETSHVVAIKRLDSMSNQGAAEFRAEIEMLSKLRHRHLVSLIGFCDDNKEMVLVYEYMPHGTLHHHLHKACTYITWILRLKIAIGAAHGLDYLHNGIGTQHGVIHRDIKSSNILLDENWEAMISDFGLSKVGPTNKSISYVDTSVKGTFGYLDPEYFYTHRLTRKTDVFAFGVVLFELLSGRLAVDRRFDDDDQCSLVRWAQKCVKDRKLDQMVDPNIRGTISHKCLRQYVRIANRLLCSVVKERPSMTEVVASLQVSLQLQEKHDNSAQSLSNMRFPWKLPKYLVPVTKENSVDSISPTKMNSVSDKTASPLRVPPSPSRFSMSPKLERSGSVHLTMSQVAQATQNFSSSLILGEGGFGTVYKAQLQNGQVVAIKRAKKGCKRAETASELLEIDSKKTRNPLSRARAQATRVEHFDALRSEFISEVELLAKIDHLNIVKLLGYIDKGNEHLIIIEYVPNGTLREHLDGIHGSFLDFSQRLEISIDIAHSLTYLHLYAEKQIIHRDVTSSNILLTDRKRAKVADFGFAKLVDAVNDKMPIMTKVMGTVGYVDPEYLRTYQLTPKSDVYSFGVVLIEILTGRRAVELRRSYEERVTLKWAFRKFKDGEVINLVDPLLKEDVDVDIFAKMLGLAFQCVAPTRVDRPDMKAVGEQLWAIRMEYLRHGDKGN